MKDSAQIAASTPPPKEPYEQPQLVRYGSIHDLTAAGASKAVTADLSSLGA
jgi:hypothetical protein